MISDVVDPDELRGLPLHYCEGARRSEIDGDGYTTIQLMFTGWLKSDARASDFKHPSLLPPSPGFVRRHYCDVFDFGSNRLTISAIDVEVIADDVQPDVVV